MSAHGTTQASNNGIGCFTVLGFIFITLKLTGNIDWSWWWVLAPFWGPLAFGLLFVSLAALIGTRRS